MKDTFSQVYHMPLLVLFVTVAWMMIFFRVSTFRKHYQATNTLSGLSVFFSILAGVFATVYVALSMATFSLDQDLFNFFDKIMMIGANPAMLPATDCKWVLKRVVSAIKITYVCRVFLTLVLWAVKGSLLAMYLQCRPILKPIARFFLRITGPILIATLTIALWMMVQSFISYPYNPSFDDVRSGAFLQGISFDDLGDVEELFLSTMNLVTDILLTFLAWRSVKALPCTSATGWLLVSIGSTTIVIASIRFSIVIITLTCDAACQASGRIEQLAPPTMVLAEVEAFAAVMVSCLPGLRAVLRTEHLSLQVRTEYTASEYSNSPRIIPGTPRKLGGGMSPYQGSIGTPEAW